MTGIIRLKDLTVASRGEEHEGKEDLRKVHVERRERLR